MTKASKKASSPGFEKMDALWADMVKVAEIQFQALVADTEEREVLMGGLAAYLMSMGVDLKGLTKSRRAAFEDRVARLRSRFEVAKD